MSFAAAGESAVGIRRCDHCKTKFPSSLEIQFCFKCGKSILIKAAADEGASSTPDSIPASETTSENDSESKESSSPPIKKSEMDYDGDFVQVMVNSNYILRHIHS